MTDKDFPWWLGVELGLRCQTTKLSYLRFRSELSYR
jgi:hypothetical protein